MIFQAAQYLLLFQADTTATNGNFLGVEWADPVVWATILGLILLGLGYVFAKVRWILNPLGRMLQAYAGYRRDESHKGAKFSETEKAEMWELHIKPLLDDIALRLGNPFVDRLIGLDEPDVNTDPNIEPDEGPEAGKNI